MRTKKEINIQIGERLKAAREAAKTTQEQLAEKIEVSPQFVSDAERGLVGISLSTLKRICLVLGISSDQLLFGSNIRDRSVLLAEKSACLSDRQFDALLEIVDKVILAMQTAE